ARRGAGADGQTIAVTASRCLVPSGYGGSLSRAASCSTWTLNSPKHGQTISDAAWAGDPRPDQKTGLHDPELDACGAGCRGYPDRMRGQGCIEERARHHHVDPSCRPSANQGADNHSTSADAAHSESAAW